MANTKLVFRGSHVLRIADGTAHLFELAADKLQPLGSFAMSKMPSAVDVCATQPWVCWRDDDHDGCWSWRPGASPTQVAARVGTRDHAAVGFIGEDSEALLAVAQGNELRLLDSNHAIRGAVELRRPRPHAWSCHRFSSLGNGLVAVTGNLFSDPQDMIITVALHDLLNDPRCLQRAIEEGRLVHDRADKLVVGRAPNSCAIVVRDPGEEEPLEDKDDESPDVWGLRGFYIRSLEDSRLVTYAVYRSAFEKDAAAIATDRVIALEVPGGVDVIDRDDATVRTIRGEEVCLDPVNARVGSMSSTGEWQVTQLG